MNAAAAVVLATNLIARIDSPASGSAAPVSAIPLAIHGTANGTNFESFQLSYQPDGAAATNWMAIGVPVTTPVTNGLLGQFPAELPSGLYRVRLMATFTTNIQSIVEVDLTLFTNTPP